MRYSLKITLLIFLVCFCSIGTYVFGYFQGYLGGLGHPAMANALGTVNALNAIRAEKNKMLSGSPLLLLKTPHKLNSEDGISSFKIRFTTRYYSLV